MSNVIVDLLEFLAILIDINNENSTRNVLYKNDSKQEPYIPKTRDEYIKHQQKVTNIKFAIIFYSYLLYEDDNKISFGEMREIKRLVSEKEGFLSKDDQYEIRQIIKTKKHTLYNVIEYAKKNYISYAFVLQMIEHFKLTTENDKRYKYPLEKLHRRFIVEKDYLQ